MERNKMEEYLIRSIAWLAPVRFYDEPTGEPGSQQSNDGSGDGGGGSSGDLANADGSSGSDGDGTDADGGSSKSSQTNDSGGDNTPATLEEAITQIESLTKKVGKQGLEMGNLRKIQKSYSRLSKSPAAIAQLAKEHGLEVVNKNDGAIQDILKKADQADGNVGEIVRGLAEAMTLTFQTQLQEVKDSVGETQMDYEDQVVETRVVRAFPEQEREGLTRQADEISAQLDSRKISITEVLMYAGRGMNMKDIVKRATAEGFKQGETSVIKRAGGSIPTGGVRTSMIQKPAGQGVLSEQEGLERLYPDRYPKQKEKA